MLFNGVGLESGLAGTEPQGAQSCALCEELSLLPAGMQGMFWKLWQVQSFPPYPGNASVFGVKDQGVAASCGLGTPLGGEDSHFLSSSHHPCAMGIVFLNAAVPNRALGRAVGLRASVWLPLAGDGFFPCCFGCFWMLCLELHRIFDFYQFLRCEHSPELLGEMLQEEASRKDL